MFSDTRTMKKGWLDLKVHLSFQAVFLVLDPFGRHNWFDMSFSRTLWPYEFAWKMKHFLGIPFEILKSDPNTHVQFNIIFKKRPRILYVVLKETVCILDISHLSKAEESQRFVHVAGLLHISLKMTV